MKENTKEQIEDEINKLQKMKPTVRRHDIFGSDHHEAIDAQVEALKDFNNGVVLDSDDAVESAEQEYRENYGEELPDNIRDEVSYALQWATGEESDSPSESWSFLVQE